MAENQDNKKTTVHIEHVNPQNNQEDLKEYNMFKAEQEENLSKTQQFKKLNAKRKNSDVDLPILKASLTDTIRIKISDLRKAVEEKNENAQQTKPKKSLYDTVIIKLDQIINKKSALKGSYSKKVTNIEVNELPKKKFHLFKPRDITKLKLEKIKINVDSEEFGRQLYNLNKLALMNLGLERPKTIRRFTPATRLEKIDNVHISKHNYLKYQQKLNRFAVNKLYYKFAPKESKKYKIYKYSVILSSIVFFVTSAIIINWFVQGISVNNLSNSLIETADIVEIADQGEIYNQEAYDFDVAEAGVEVPPEPEKNDEYSNKKSMYWKYLNTPLSSVDFTELVKQNPDTVAWIIVNNTNVNYPVVQTSNNEYYLSHSFDRSSNGAGWVFADFRDNFNNFSNNTVIYAHGRKDKVMFGSLTNTLNAKWYTNLDNQIIQLSTPKYNTMWQIFSIYKIQAESYYITTDFVSDQSFTTFINNMKERSIYDFGVDVTKDDKLLTLSTCFNDNGIRLVVQAKLVKIQER